MKVITVAGPPGVGKTSVIIHLVGFGFLLIVVTGVYDWYRRKKSLVRK